MSNQRVGRLVVLLAVFGLLVMVMIPTEGTAGVEPSPFLSGIWGAAGDDICAVGEDGVIMRWDGRRWAEQESPTERDLTALWGTGSDFMLAVGQGAVIMWNENEWVMGVEPSPFMNDIWGFGADDVWAVGDDGVALHYDGEEWREVDTGVDIDLNGLWGARADELWAVGDGSIIKWNQHEWVMGVEPSPFLNAISGSSASDVWAVGDRGSMLHYDGRSWREVESGTEEDLLGVWASSSSEVWAVGTGGTVIHYDGRRWSNVVSGTERDLNDVWMSPEGAPIAVGDHVIWTPSRR